MSATKFAWSQKLSDSKEPADMGTRGLKGMRVQRSTEVWEAETEFRGAGMGTGGLRGQREQRSTQVWEAKHRVRKSRRGHRRFKRRENAEEQGGAGCLRGRACCALGWRIRWQAKHNWCKWKTGTSRWALQAKHINVANGRQTHPAGLCKPST
eukprot:537769-Pelagomonas_calceolata.AAC.4